MARGEKADFLLLMTSGDVAIYLSGKMIKVFKSPALVGEGALKK